MPTLIASKEDTFESIPEENTAHSEAQVSREELIKLLNEDLSGEYQAIISYVVYSQVLSGAEYMNIAAELLIISKQIDYLGGMPAVQPKPVRTSEKAKEMLRFDLENEMATIQRYRQREGLGEYAWPSIFARF